RQITPDAPESVRPRSAAEAARDLLLHLHHPQVSFRLVVVERHREVPHERQRFPLIPFQPSKQVPGFALRGSTPLGMRSSPTAASPGAWFAPQPAATSRRYSAEVPSRVAASNSRAPAARASSTRR